MMKKKNLLNYLLLLCCLGFSLAVGPCDLIVESDLIVEGVITCDSCEMEVVDINIIDCRGDIIAEDTLECGSYSYGISPSYLGEQIMVGVQCDEDGDGEISIGDRVGGGQYFEAKQTNQRNIDINQEITASVEGNVICDPYDNSAGDGYVWAWSGSFNDNTTTPSLLGFTYEYFDLNTTSNYKVFLHDTSVGTELWFVGTWDKDDNRYCHGDQDPISPCDWMGMPGEAGDVITLESVEMTGVDLNICAFQKDPCSE